MTQQNLTGYERFQQIMAEINAKIQAEEARKNGTDPLNNLFNQWFGK